MHVTGQRGGVIFLTGPTGTGKSDLSLQLCRYLPCEIISVDSVLVYRGMDVGTAKPSLEARNRVRHHLIDILDPAEIYSAAAFRKSALELIDRGLSAGRIPLLVGGTMFYFHALEYGFDYIPEVGDTVRREIAEEERRLGLAILYARLKRIDAATASRLQPNDSQRIKRALEVYYSSGRKMSEYRSVRRNTGNFPFRVLKYGLTFNDRSALHSNLELRFDRMLEQGFINEVSRLILRGDLSRDVPSMRTIGYSQVWSHLAGECRYDEMRHRALSATRQLVKKQLTWMRSMQGIRWREIDRSGMQALVKEIAQQAAIDFFPLKN